MTVRCPWCGNDKDYVLYHDTEWGKPTHDDKLMFEYLVLEAMQAGLSWITILKKRSAFKAAFDNFDPKIVALYDQNKITELLSNKDIVRNRRKIEASIKNARIFLEVQQQFGSFDKYIWSFTDNTPIINSFRSVSEIPAKTELSERISKDLKKRGFLFVGPTIIYSYMQAIGMVNDHLDDCDFKYR